MDFYKKNMRILKSKNKKLYNKILEFENSDSLTIKNSDEDQVTIFDERQDIKINLENSRSGDYTIRIKYLDREIYLHSKYYPRKEAERQIKDLMVKDKKQIFALGFGLGYHLNELAKRNKYDKVIIIESYISIFYVAIKYVDLSNLLRSKNIIYLIGEDISSLFDVIRAYYSLSLEKEIEFLEQKAEINLFNDEYKEIYNKIKEGINFKKITLATDIKRSREWKRNIINNIPYIINKPKADDFFNIFQNIPVICVAAGPSLDKNIDQLKRVKNNTLIMCVGTSLKPLLKNEIEPDIVVSIDGNIANLEHFKDIETIPDSYLFAELGNYYEIQDKWDEKQVFLTMKRNFSGWIEEIKGKYTSINTGGTVAHSMVDLAYKFGADPIILMGQDLAFTDEKSHASGTTYENKEVNNQNLIEVEAVDGGTVLTNKSFLSMLSYFNNYFAKRPGRTYIDATEGGAKIDNTVVMKLSEVIDEYLFNNNDLNVREILDENFEENLKLKDESLRIRVLTQFETTLEELEKAISIAGEQLSLIASIEKQLSKTNSIDKSETKRLEKEVLSYEKELNKLDYISYFIERILIVESMRYKEVTSKFYLDKKQELEEKMKYYRSYRVMYLRELENSKKLFKKAYQDYIENN
ncbi:6-hydroxymethylpterin diphosphokinase MptE-like protein [Halanaerobium congolense]|uniref:motility associated factor glycosyltransferase family protein n=1 Tax=Halanaerobium congolense TaxID=54121 RepID=UPI00105F18EB|nr:6-hydroxymethylpterin diphosphokinase MptE-like protein [Halanaerobium congolense]TDP26391.1 hypothetical protein C8C79_104109 [Halanaerobium congolense]